MTTTTLPAVPAVPAVPVTVVSPVVAETVLAGAAPAAKSKIVAILFASLILCSCAEYPAQRQPTRQAAYMPKSWWDDSNASGSPKIVVHKGEQQAYFYKGGTLVSQTDCSTGKPGFTTPSGHYSVLAKDLHHVSTIYDVAMPYAMFFASGYAVHQGWVLPYACSHGCIRLPPAVAGKFYANAPIGTPVTVTE